MEARLVARLEPLSVEGEGTDTAKPLSGDGLQRYSVSFEYDGLLRKCHGNV